MESLKNKQFRIEVDFSECKNVKKFKKYFNKEVFGIQFLISGKEKRIVRYNNKDIEFFNITETKFDNFINIVFLLPDNDLKQSTQRSVNDRINIHHDSKINFFFYAWNKQNIFIKIPISVFEVNEEKGGSISELPCILKPNKVDSASTKVNSNGDASIDFK